MLHCRGCGSAGVQSCVPANFLIATLRVAPVAISEVEPYRAVFAQHALDFTKDGNGPLHVCFNGFLKSDLSFDAVVSETPAGRRSDYAIHGFVREFLESLEAVTVDDAAPFYLASPFTFLLSN